MSDLGFAVERLQHAVDEATIVRGGHTHELTTIARDVEALKMLVTVLCEEMARLRGDELAPEIKRHLGGVL